MDELCAGSKLQTSEILRRLRRILRRRLSRQTLTAWRRGSQDVPVSVLLALAVIQQRTLADVSVTVAMRVMGDPKSDPDFRISYIATTVRDEPRFPPNRFRPNRNRSLPGL
jgi:hypothetical protein